MCCAIKPCGVCWSIQFQISLVSCEPINTAYVYIFYYNTRLYILKLREIKSFVVFFFTLCYSLIYFHIIPKIRLSSFWKVKYLWEQYWIRKWKNLVLKSVINVPARLYLNRWNKTQKIDTSLKKIQIGVRCKTNMFFFQLFPLKSENDIIYTFLHCYHFVFTFLSIMFWYWFFYDVNLIKFYLLYNLKIIFPQWYKVQCRNKEVFKWIY